MSVSEIVQRLELLGEHCKIEATKVARLWGMHEGVLALQMPHVVPPSPATPAPAAPATNGLRTERVVLEITIAADQIPTGWPWDSILRRLVRADKGESVRVVDEAATFSAACPIAGGTVKVNGQDMVTLTEFLRHTTKLTQEAGVAKRERDAAIRERDESKARVAELESQLEAAPAASGNSSGILTSSPAASGAAGTEPVAWGVRRSDGTWWESFRATRDAMLSVTTGGGDANNVVSPLYAAPQPAKGWLTKKDREWLTYLLQNFPVSSPVNEWIHSLLARSTPPEVVHPAHRGAPEIRERDSWWRKALAAAGVKVKEVGK